jgi:hypothetical protein
MEILNFILSLEQAHGGKRVFKPMERSSITKIVDQERIIYPLDPAPIYCRIFPRIKTKNSRPTDVAMNFDFMA